MNGSLLLVLMEARHLMTADHRLSLSFGFFDSLARVTVLYVEF